MSARKDETLVLSVAEAARMLGVSDDTIYRLLDQGDLPELPRWSQRRLIPLRAIELVIDAALADFDPATTLRRLKAAS